MCLNVCACVCLLIELRVLKGLRGVHNGACSRSTPVAARRRRTAFDVKYPHLTRIKQHMVQQHTLDHKQHDDEQQ